MSRSIRVAPQHIVRVRRALRHHGFPSQNALAQELGISRSTTSRFFLGKSVDYSYFVEISEKLGLDWEAIAYIEEDLTVEVEPVPPLKNFLEEKQENKMLEIDWMSVCRDMLQAQNQRRLTTNPLTAGDGVAFELDEIHVPLGLVSRKYRSRLIGDVSPEQGSRIYALKDNYEIIDILQQDTFLRQIMFPYARKDVRNKRIAIIGEPGVGKTTLLQKIAASLLGNSLGYESIWVPIWISLADLQGKSIEEYLLSDWLKAATRKVRVTDAMQDALGKLFNSKRVWLLLDGVDEMVMGTQSHTPLQWIANQFTGWVGNANVILTCRLNLWDVGKNALEAFDTYCNLDFSYGDVQTPDQVGQFIRRWFQGNSHLAECLRNELNQPGKERIKDTVKNPLRLALLCRSWALGQGKLPNTKAKLYQQFTEAVYEWKKDRFPTNSSQRQELNRALGELALKAISEEKTKFRLRHQFVCSVLGEPDTALFRLALQLGWLNQVGVAAEAEDLGENVYAFYHPTFQEYFAALAIEDWHYFLNHSRRNLAQGSYRIFEPQWKEVILLWLGRGDVVKELKENFIAALVEFEDGCKDFYRYQAYFLAAAGISEFGDCSRASEIVEQIIKWSFGYFNVEKQEWKTFIEPIEDNARTTLTQTQTSLTITALTQLISSTQDESVRRQAVFSLAKIDPGNQEAIKALVEIIYSTKDEYIRKPADFRLREVSPDNQEAIKTLLELISSTNDESICSEAAFKIGQIDPGNQEAIKVLLEIIYSTKDEYIRRQAAFRLEEIDIDLVNINLFQKLNRVISSGTICGVSGIGKVEPVLIRLLVQLISSSGDDGDEPPRIKLIRYLKRIGTNNIRDKILPQLLHLLNKSPENEYRRRLSDSLAVAAVLQLIESSDNEFLRLEGTWNLGITGIGNLEAIAALLQLIESSDEDEFARIEATESLGKIGIGNLEAIAALMQLIKSTGSVPTNSSKDKSIRRQAVYSLKKILRDDQLTDVVTDLKEYLSDEIYKNDTEQFEECYTLIWHCAQIISYPDFFLAWQNDSKLL